MKKKEHSWLISGEHYKRMKQSLKGVYSVFGFEWAGNFFTENFVWRNAKAKEEIRHSYERKHEITERVKIVAKTSNEKFTKRLDTLLARGIVTIQVEELLKDLDSKFLGQIRNLKHDAGRGKQGAAVWLKMVQDDYDQQKRKILEQT